MLLKGLMVGESFYPFVENGAASEGEAPQTLQVRHPARIAVFDDAAAAPRVVVIEPTDIRSYLEEITATVTRLSQEQGGAIPFMVIREVVENLIHAYFMEPTVSILDGGNTIRFSDQGPGISDKDRALEYGTTSATAEMKRYIRGVGSGLPYAQQWLEGKGGSLTVEDNIHNGTVVTVSLAQRTQDALPQSAPQPDQMQQQPLYQQVYQQPAPAGWQQAPQQPWAQGYPPATYPGQPLYPQQGYPYPQQGYPYGQPWGQPAAQPWATAPQMPQQQPALSDRERTVLEYLRTHESVGPRDLSAWQSGSESTWSRTLQTLEDKGIIAKHGGQKRFLTETGRHYLGFV